MKRLIDLHVIDAENEVYRKPPGNLIDVFDGGVGLSASQYDVDDIDRRLKLKSRPAGQVMALMETEL